MPSSVTKKSTGRVAGALFLVSMLALELCHAYPIMPLGDDFEPVLRVVVEELERQGLMSRVYPRAVGPRTRNGIIRKSISSRDFRLRFGKRSMSVVPLGISLEAGQSGIANRQGTPATNSGD